MLGQFFWSQWNQPVKGDWVTTVKEDLEILGFGESINQLKSYSTYKLKDLLKRRIENYTFYQLQAKKCTLSKLSHLSYPNLELQNYFKLHDLTAVEMRNIFAFRVRMKLFGENFRGDGATTYCPLCKDHIDSQDLIGECTVIKNKFKEDILSHVKNVYSQHQTIESLRLVNRVLDCREEMIDKKTVR